MPGGMGIVPNAGALFGGAASTQAGGAAPSSAESAANIDMATSIMNDLYKPLSSATLTAGMVPTSTATAMPVPPSMTRPIKEFQQRPMNTEPVVGKGNARARGIGNAITGVTNALGTVIQADAQKRQDKLVVSTQNLLQAQSAIDQAKQYLNSPDITPQQKKQLEDIIEHNTKVMNTTLDDKNTRKGLEKGLNISFTDPSKNKTPEHNAIQKALESLHLKKPNQPQQAKEGGAGKFQTQASPQGTFQQQFSAQMPQKIGPDPVAAMQSQLAIKQKEADYKLAQSLIPRLLTAHDAKERLFIHENYENIRQNARQANSWREMTARFAQMEKMAGIQHDYKIDEISYYIDAANDRLQQTLMSRELDPQKLQTNLTKLDEDYVKGKASLTDKISRDRLLFDKVMGERDIAQGEEGANADAIPDSKTHQYNLQLYWLDHDIKASQQGLTEWDKFYKDNRAIWEGIKNEADRQRNEMVNPSRGIPNAPTTAAPSGDSTSKPGPNKPSPYGPPISGGGIPSFAPYGGQGPSPISSNIGSFFGEEAFLFPPETYRPSFDPVAAGLIEGEAVDSGSSADDEESGWHF